MNFESLAPARASVAPVLRALDRDFQRFVHATFANPATPSVRVTEDDKAWTLSMDLPGVAREDLSITVEEDVVRLSTRDEARRKYQGAWRLPQAIDGEATEAKLENGELTLRLAKPQPVDRSRRIAVN